MYRFERLLLNARQLRVRRAQRARGESREETEAQWLEEWQAARFLVMDLAGVEDVIVDEDGGPILDGRRKGMEAILAVDPLGEFVERGAGLLLSLAREMKLAELIVKCSEEKVRECFEAREPGDKPFKPGYVDDLLKKRASALGDAAVLAIESALFEVARKVRLANDLERPIGSREESVLGDSFEIVKGRLRKRRKPRRRVSHVVGKGSVGVAG